MRPREQTESPKLIQRKKGSKWSGKWSLDIVQRIFVAKIGRSRIQGRNAGGGHSGEPWTGPQEAGGTDGQFLGSQGEISGPSADRHEFPEIRPSRIRFKAPEISASDRHYPLAGFDDNSPLRILSCA